MCVKRSNGEHQHYVLCQTKTTYFFYIISSYDTKMFCIFTITCCPRPSRYTLTASTLLITGRLALRTTGLVAIISIFLIITTVTYAIALHAPVGTQLIAHFLTICPELASRTFSNTLPRYSVTI